MERFEEQKIYQSISKVSKSLRVSRPPSDRMRQNQELLYQALQNLPKPEQESYKTVSKLLQSNSIKPHPNKSVKNTGDLLSREFLIRTKSLKVASELISDEAGECIEKAWIDRIHFKHPSYFFLYIGNFKAANDQSTLTECHINAILTLGKNSTDKYPSVKGGYRQIEIIEDDDLFPFFEEIYTFLHTNLQKGNVLVHCFSGENRSCAVAIYFLMRALNMNFSRAVSCVEESRNNQVDISSSYENQLKTAERILRKQHK